MNFADRYNIKYYIQKLLSQQDLLAVYCADTNMPLVECSTDTYNDRVFVFENEDLLKEFVKPYQERKLKLRGIKFLAKDKMKFFSTILSINVDELVYVDKTGRHVVRVGDFLKKQDFSKLPKEKRPVENPQLQLSGIYFVQEASRDVPPEEKVNLKELEEELAANLVKANFILPVIFTQEPSSAPENTAPAADDGQAAAQDNSQEQKIQPEPKKREFKIPLIKTPQEEMFMPLFTDSIEFSKYNRDGKCSAMVIPFATLPKILAKEAKGYMLNPNGFHIHMPLPLLQSLALRFGTETQNASARTPEAAVEEALRKQDEIV